MFIFSDLSVVDSISIEISQALYIHTAVSAVIVNDRSQLKQAMNPGQSAAYLSEGDHKIDYNPYEYCYDLSRPANIITIWFVLRSFGLKQIRRILENNVSKKNVQYLVSHRIKQMLCCFKF